MIIYAVFRNGSSIKGRFFACPEHAVDFFKENFSSVYPNVNFDTVEENLLLDINKYGIASVQSGSDLWEIIKYVSD